MTTDETARAVLAGEVDPLGLWEAVRRFVYGQARKWVQVGTEQEDLVQEGFIAMLDALEAWDPEKGAFLTLYGLHLKRAFTSATGQRTQRDRLDPLRDSLSLSAPMTDDQADSFTLADILEDPAAEGAVTQVDEQDFQESREEAVKNALASLPEDQRGAVVSVYYHGKEADKKALRDALRSLRHPSVSRSLEEFL